MRVCAKCGADKPESEFYNAPCRRDGLMSACKECHLARCAERRRQDPGYLARWREKNPTAWATWYAANRQKRLDYHHAWGIKNAARKAENFAAWAKANPERVNAISAKRNAAKLRAVPAWADQLAIRAIYREAARLRRETGERYEVDHIVPLQGRTVCGLHWEGNLQVISKTANLSKHNRRWPGMP